MHRCTQVWDKHMVPAFCFTYRYLPDGWVDGEHPGVVRETKEHVRPRTIRRHNADRHMPRNALLFNHAYSSIGPLARKLKPGSRLHPYSGGAE